MKYFVDLAIKRKFPGKVFSLKKKPKARHIKTVKNCWRKYRERNESEKSNESTNNVIIPIEQQTKMESNENFNLSLHDNIDGRQIPAENISQENCNLKDMK